MLKITEENYNHYKKILEVFCNILFKDSPVVINDENSPIIILERWEQKSKSLARKSLKITLLDTFSMLEDAPIEYYKALEEELLKSGLPILANLISIVKDIKVKVLKRGKIKDVNEWYVIKEILDKTDSDISPIEREQLGKLFYDFEYKKRKNK